MSAAAPVVERVSHDGWAELILNRPEQRNALSAELVTSLAGLARAADHDPGVHAIVISGAGRDFCAGYDLRAGGGSGYADHRADRAGYFADLTRVQSSAEPIRSLLGIRKPIVAKVHGNCLAGGTDLAFVCDIVIVADDAVIGFPPTRDLGSPPLPMWLYHVGPQWAKRLLLTGDSISGADAATIGLVLKAVPRDRLDGEVAGLMARMAHIDYELLSVQKRIVNAGLQLMGAATLLDMAAEFDVRAHLSPSPLRLKADAPENVVEVLKRRRSEYFGRGLARVSQPDEYDSLGRLT
jgi:enoyl-CoA hydratase